MFPLPSLLLPLVFTHVAPRGTACLSSWELSNNFLSKSTVSVFGTLHYQIKTNSGYILKHSHILYPHLSSYKKLKLAVSSGQES